MESRHPEGQGRDRRAEEREKERVRRIWEDSTDSGADDWFPSAVANRPSTPDTVSPLRRKKQEGPDTRGFLDAIRGRRAKRRPESQGTTPVARPLRDIAPEPERRPSPAPPPEAPKPPARPAPSPEPPRSPEPVSARPPAPAPPAQPPREPAPPAREPEPVRAESAERAPQMIVFEASDEGHGGGWFARMRERREHRALRRRAAKRRAPRQTLGDRIQNLRSHDDESHQLVAEPLRTAAASPASQVAEPAERRGDREPTRIELPPPPERRGGRRLVAVLAAVAILAAAGAAAILAGGDDDSTPSGNQAATPPAEEQPSDNGGGAAAPEEPSGGAAEEEKPAKPERPALTWPEGRSGYTAILFVSSSDRATARDRARAADRAGYTAGVLRSSNFNLEPGFWVTFAGVYSSRARAQRAADDLGARGLSAAPYVRHVQPD